MTGARARTFRRWSWFIIAALVLVALARTGTSDGPARSEAEIVRQVAATIKCPTCRSQSVAGSDAASARAIRQDITRRVRAGESSDEIRAAVAATYGDDVLLTPGRSGVEGVVWALPVIAVVLALAGVSAAFARWRRDPSARPTEDDVRLVEQARSARRRL